MNLEEVKNIIYEVTAKFFTGATVIWAEQINTKPPLPYITLKIGEIKRSSFAVINKNGVRYYPASITLEVNLYTKGMPVTIGENVTGNYSNTATSDLLEFFNFIDSEEITDVVAGKGIDILLILPIRDLTELKNDSKYRYRAMAEATVSFSMEAEGRYAIKNNLIGNFSGGDIETREDEISYFDKVEISELGGKNDEK